MSRAHDATELASPSARDEHEEDAFNLSLEEGRRLREEVEIDAEEELELELDLEEEEEEGEGAGGGQPPPARGFRAAAEQAADADAPRWYLSKPALMCYAGCALVLVVLFVSGVIGGPNLTTDVTADSYPLEYLPIVQSTFDPRSYRFVQLASNSLPVLLIHDAATVSSAASMSVGTGSASNPPGVEGLAHYLEHALFMGSESFPDEHAYAAFLAAHGGASNAYTADFETNYFFDVQPDDDDADDPSDTDALEEGDAKGKGKGAGSGQGGSTFRQALSMFAGFFTSPLLHSSSLSREMHAVDNEHRKNVLNDDWRSMQLLRSLSNTGSSFNRFGTGTLDTLNRSDISELLREFYKEHYRASNMNLVLLGRESLEELEGLATQLFGGIPGPTMTGRSKEKLTVRCEGEGKGKHCVRVQRGFEPPAHSRPFDSPFDAKTILPFPAPRALGAKNTAKYVSMVPVSAPAHSLGLYFPLPSSKAPAVSGGASGTATAGGTAGASTSRFAQDAASFLAYILGHEGGERTLCTALKRAGLARGVSVGAVEDWGGRVGGVDQSLFGVEVTLTEEGNSVQGRKQVIETVFHAIEMLAQTSQDVRAQYYSTMLSEMGVRWTFAEKSAPGNMVQTLSGRMGQLLGLGVPVEDILLPPERVRSFGGGDAITEALQCLTKGNVLVLRSSSDLQDARARDEVAPAGEWRTEPWYGVLYHVQNMEDGLISDATSTPLELELPPLRNEFLPHSFDVLDINSMVRAAEQEGSTPGPATATLRATVGDFDTSAPNAAPVALPPLDSTTPPVSHRLFYEPDLRFQLPYAYYSLFLRYAPGVGSSSENMVRLQLYTLALGEVLAADRYQMAQVNAKVSLDAHPARQGVGVTIQAFGSNIEQVVRLILPRLVDLQGLTDARLAQLRLDLLEGGYKTYNTSMQPYQHAVDFQKLWEERDKRSMQELQQVLESPPLGEADLTVDRQRAWVREVFAQVGVVSFAYGNINITTAQTLHAHAVDTLQSAGLGAALTFAQLAAIEADVARMVYKLGEPRVTGGGDASGDGHTSLIFRHPVLNPVEQNSAVLFNLQVGPTGGDDDSTPTQRDLIRRGVLLSLLAQLLGESAFNILRTRWSLGYMVWGQVRESLGGMAGEHSVANFDIIVQNAYNSPRELEGRIEEFLLLFQSEVLAPLTAEGWEEQRRTLRVSLQQAQVSALSMTSHFLHSHAAIWCAPDRPAFGREAAQLRQLAEVRQGELLAFYEAYFTRADTRRKTAMLVYGAGQREEEDATHISKRSEAVRALLTADVPLAGVTQRDEQRRTQWDIWATSEG